MGDYFKMRISDDRYVDSTLYFFSIRKYNRIINCTLYACKMKTLQFNIHSDLTYYTKQTLQSFGLKHH